MSLNAIPRNTICLLMVMVVAVLGAWIAPGAEREPDPAYWTDTHGATGVVWAMLSLVEADAKYIECAEQTLAWLDHVKLKDDRGRVTWRLSESADFIVARAVRTEHGRKFAPYVENDGPRDATRAAGAK